MCIYGTNRPARGAALVIVMLVMAVLLLAGTTFLTISSTESQIALNERATAQAFELAEAGLHKALAQLDVSSSYPGETSSLILGSGTSSVTGSFTVTVTPAAVQTCPANAAKDVVVRATLPVRNREAWAQIGATVDQISYPYRWAAFAAVPNQVVMSPNQTIFGADDRTESEVWLRDNSRTDSFDSRIGPYNPTSDSSASPPPNPFLNSSQPDARTGGNIGANGDITLNNVKVGGTVRAGDALHKPSGVVPTGGYVESLSPNETSVGEPLPSVNPPAGLVVTSSLPEQPSGTIATLSSGSLSVTSGTLTLPAAGSPYYFSGMTFSNGTALATSGDPVTIYVTGSVTLGNNVTFGSHPGTQLRIVLKSDGTNWLDAANFSTGSSFTLYGSLYGKYTNLQFQDWSQIYGSVIGRTVVLHQNAGAHFDQAMLNQEICRSGRYTIRRGTWREVVP